MNLRLILYLLVVYWVLCYGYIFYACNTLMNKGSEFFQDLVVIILLNDICAIQPVTIYCKRVLFPFLLSGSLKRLLSSLKRQSKLLALRTSGLIKDSKCMIQHLNPACRAARSFPELVVSRLLFGLRDDDLLIQNLRLSQFTILSNVNFDRIYLFAIEGIITVAIYLLFSALVTLTGGIILTIVILGLIFPLACALFDFIYTLSHFSDKDANERLNISIDHNTTVKRVIVQTSLYRTPLEEHLSGKESSILSTGVENLTFRPTIDIPVKTDLNEDTTDEAKLSESGECFDRFREPDYSKLRRMKKRAHHRKRLTDDSSPEILQEMNLPNNTSSLKLVHYNSVPSRRRRSGRIRSDDILDAPGVHIKKMIEFDNNSKKEGIRLPFENALRIIDEPVVRGERPDNEQSPKIYETRSSRRYR